MAQRDKLAIIAGRGPLPLLVAEACQADGRPFFIAAIEGEGEPDLERYPHAWVRMGEIGRTLEILREAACESIVFAGPVTRPDFRSLKFDKTALKLLPRVLGAARKGDDALLSLLLSVFEENGFHGIGADDVLADAVAAAGVQGACTPTEADRSDIARGLEVVRAIGRLDIGQGAVVCDGLVLAVEAAEGTDAMLQRCADLPADLRGSPEARRGVLVKLPKPQQERRVDLPVIGPTTIENAAAAGLAGIAVEAGGALILGRDALVRSADEAGLFVIGLAMPVQPAKDAGSAADGQA